MNVVEILNRACQDFPEQIAIIEAQSGQSQAYQDLFIGAIKLAKKINTYFTTAPPLLALCAPKSTESLMALLAIQQAGAAYIPLDASGAIERNLLIVRDCKPAGIFLSADWANIFFEKLSCTTELIALPETELHLLLCHWEKPIDLVSNLAFILYTSGSTGQPKGVQITHQNAWAFIDWANQTFEIPPGKVCTSIAPFHFDLSVFDIYVTLSKGASLLLIDQKSAKNPRLVAQWFHQYQVHTTYATPSFLKLLLRHGRLEKFNFQQLKQVLFAGEVFDIQSLKALKERWSQAVFHNLYGPTETNVVTWFQVPGNIPAEQSHPFPIGKSCASSLAKIWLNEALLELKPGLEGELAISGPSVSPGYLNLAERTAQNFILDQTGTRFYLTGDWVSVDESNHLVFKGRKDRMIKRRGYRIELAEIERALAAHPLLLSAACIAKAEKIIAFCSTKKDQAFPSALELNQFLMAYLPAYMLPDSYRQITDLPQTSTQKIDYPKLALL